MSLQASRILSGLHPWLAARVRWLGEVATLYGSGQTLISGTRTITEQGRLYDFQGNRPAAYPGCSQHQYGFAVDATYLPIVQITSKGKPFIWTPAETTSAMNNAARHVGLTVVANDDGHYQVFPGIQFREYIVAVGLCPQNPPPPLWNIAEVQASNDAYRDCLLAASRSNRLLGADSPSFSCPQPCGPLFNRLC